MKGCRIGLWGAFDVDSFGDALVPQVLRRELAARLPGAEFRLAAPFGSLRPTPRDGGEPAEPFGPWSPERAAELANGLDCIVIAGVDLLSPERFFLEPRGPNAEHRCPVVWWGVSVGSDPAPDVAERLRAAAAGVDSISARDRASRRRLQEAGIQQEVAVVPDVAVLAPRLYAPDLRSRRLDLLRALGWYPESASPMLIEASAERTRYVEPLAVAIAGLLEHRPEVSVVVADLGSPGDTACADALTDRLASTFPGANVTRLPADVGLEDVAAAICSCAAFVGPPTSAALVAFAAGRPQVVLCMEGAPELAGLPEVDEDRTWIVRLPEDIEGCLLKAVEAGGGLEAGAAPGTEAAVAKQVDTELDRLAELIAGASRVRSKTEGLPSAARLEELTERLRLLEVAYEARSRNHARERMIFAEQLNSAAEEIESLTNQIIEMREEYRRQVEYLQSHAKSESAAKARVESELELLRATKTLRYTAAVRSAYGRLRGLRPPPAD
jgi:hypothetical protein